jgi:hypothetical protein
MDMQRVPGLFRGEEVAASFIEHFLDGKMPDVEGWFVDSMIQIRVFKNSFELSSVDHSLSPVLMSSPLPRRASFFAAPKKEGKKRAF